MPLKKCTKDGKSGYKWGDTGHCYTGKDAKKKAIKQGIAIEGPEKFAKIEKTGGFTYDDLADIYHDKSFGDDEVRSIFMYSNLISSSSIEDLMKLRVKWSEK